MKQGNEYCLYQNHNGYYTVVLRDDTRVLFLGYNRESCLGWIKNQKQKESQSHE